MSLAHYQDALAQILTDGAFRALFLDDPESACAAHGLDAGETASLLEIDRVSMALHADLLSQARVMLALKALPVTEKILGPRVGDTVAGFCAAYPPVPSGAPTLITECLRYAAYLSDGAAARLGLPPYTQDVARYETAMVEHSASIDAWAAAAALAQPGENVLLDEDAFASSVPVVGANVRVESFAYDVAGLIEALERDGSAQAASFATPCTLVFVKIAGRRQLDTLRITPDVRTLLALCDGTATGGTIAVRLSERARARGRDAEDMLSSVYRAAESLRRKHVLSYRTGTPAAT